MDFCQDISLCEIIEEHVIVKVTFLETHMVDVRHETVRLWRVCDVP